MGGSTLYIETTTVRYANPHSENSEPTGAGQASPSSRPPSGSLKVTGQLGSVMQESSDSAYTFARHFYFVEVAPKDSSLDPAFFDQVSTTSPLPFVCLSLSAYLHACGNLLSLTSIRSSDLSLPSVSVSVCMCIWR